MGIGLKSWNEVGHTWTRWDAIVGPDCWPDAFSGCPCRDVARRPDLVTEQPKTSVFPARSLLSSSAVFSLWDATERLLGAGPDAPTPRRHRQSVYLSVGRGCRRLRDTERVYDSRGGDPGGARTGSSGRSTRTPLCRRTAHYRERSPEGVSQWPDNSDYTLFSLDAWSACKSPIRSVRFRRLQLRRARLSADTTVITRCAVRLVLSRCQVVGGDIGAGGVLPLEQDVEPGEGRDEEDGADPEADERGLEDGAGSGCLGDGRSGA